MENAGYLSPDGPVYSNHRSSCDNLSDGQHGAQRLQLKAEVAAMQTFEANIYSFG